MSCEVELKVHVKNRPALLRRLREIAVFEKDYTKTDNYWFKDGIAASGVRVRRESNAMPDGRPESFTLITYKSKESRSNIEVNRETEFEVGDAGIFEEFLRFLGLKAGYSKKKTGTMFSYSEFSNKINAELTFVEKLGDFLEIEIMLPDGAGSGQIEEARGQLLAFLALTGIGEGEIERRYYSEMLAGLENAP